MKRSLIFFVLLAFVFVTCKKDGEDGQEVQLRVQNSTDFTLEELYVSSGDGAHSFGTVEAGAFSEYASFENAYRYGYVEALVEGETLVLQPIDYVGESYLKSGHYTYQLSMEEMDGNQQLSLTLVEEE